METKKQMEEAVEEPKMQNTSGYYVAPSTTKDMKPSKSHKTQLEIGDHKYHNDTLNGKAGLLYEVGLRDEDERQSISKKLQQGIKLSEVRVVNGKKTQHVSKNWKKEGEDFLI